MIDLYEYKLMRKKIRKVLKSYDFHECEKVTTLLELMTEMLDRTHEDDPEAWFINVLRIFLTDNEDTVLGNIYKRYKMEWEPDRNALTHLKQIYKYESQMQTEREPDEKAKS